MVSRYRRNSTPCARLKLLPFTVTAGKHTIPLKNPNAHVESNPLSFIRAQESVLGVIAELELLPMPPGDVTATHADPGKLPQWVGEQPRTPLEGGLTHFRQWYNCWFTIRPV